MRKVRAGLAASGAFVLLALAAVAEDAGSASTRTEMGTVVANPELGTLSGSKVRPQDDSTLNVLVFFRPDTDYSKETLKGLAACEKRTAGKSVHWVALVSDRFPAEQSKSAVSEAGIAMPVLVDAADALSTQIAIAQLPAVAFTGKDKKLVAFQPFAKLNFCELVDARIRLLLHEISEKEFNSIVDPASTKVGGESSVARRHIKLAEAFLKSGNTEKALEPARAAVEHGPDLAASHSVLGECLRAAGKCKEAMLEFDKALALDPADSRAGEGKKACK